MKTNPFHAQIGWLCTFFLFIEFHMNIKRFQYISKEGKCKVEYSRNTSATCYLNWNNEWLTKSRNGSNISPSFVFDNSDVVACDSLLHMRNDYIQKKVDAHKVTYRNQYHDFQHCLFDSWRFIIWTTSSAFSVWDTQSEFLRVKLKMQKWKLLRSIEARNPFQFEMQ